jgi:hypothetical protein
MVLVFVLDSRRDASMCRTPKLVYKYIVKKYCEILTEPTNTVTEPRVDTKMNLQYNDNHFSKLLSNPELYSSNDSIDVIINNNLNLFALYWFRVFVKLFWNPYNQVLTLTTNPTNKF